MHSGLWLSRTLSTPRHPTLSLTGSTQPDRSPFPELAVTCNTDAARLAWGAATHGKAADGSDCVRAVRPSRTPGTAIPGEGCDFLQMTEVPPTSSVGEHSPRQYVLDQSTQPHTLPKVSRLATFQSQPASSRHAPTSPQPGLTSTDAPKSPLRGCRPMPYGSRIVADRDTSQQKRRTCADGEAFTSPVASRA